jgi:hypothetical protein
MNRGKRVQTVNFVTSMLPRIDPNPSGGHPNLRWTSRPFGEENASHID